MQSGHGVIVSIGDDLHACQAAVFGFRDIGREPAVLPFSAGASEDAPPETICRRAAWAACQQAHVSQSFKSRSF